MRDPDLWDLMVHFSLLTTRGAHWTKNSKNSAVKIVSVYALQIHTPFLTAPLKFLFFKNCTFFVIRNPLYMYTSKRQTSDWLFGKAKKASLLLQKLYLIGKNHQSGNGTQRDVRIPQCKIYFYTLSNHSSRLLLM